jgi:RNA polymerase sigma factor (sigma-70 family)
VEFLLFDADYVGRLAAGDGAAETHFTAYFKKFLSLKLRARRVPPEMSEDVQQETLLRVLKSIRQGPGVSQPERFGAFVNSVCNHVLAEFRQKQSKHPPIEEDAEELRDGSVDLESALISAERKKLVAAVLDELVDKDREILRLVFFEEADRKEVCERLKVDLDYLRVLLYRAKGQFAAAYARKYSSAKHATALIFILASVTEWHWLSQP